jgi:sugar/nucleoside kinase (ribokinase family)
MKILVAGNLVLDLLAWPVDQIRWDATVWVEQFARSVGGNGANTSFTLARLGADVSLAGALGRDAEGAELLSILTRVGVDVSRVRQLNLPTPTTIALVRRTGARAFVHRPGASREALKKVVPMRGFGHFHLANPFGVPALRTLAPAFLSAARRAGATTSMDTGWDSRGEWGKVVLPCLEYLDVLFLNEEEARLITGARGWKQALSHLPARLVVMKRGSRGAVVQGQHIPAFPVDAIDTTGAGDVFAGAFLAAWTAGESPAESALFANAAAAMSVRALGSVAGLASLSETRRWMRERLPSALPPA